MADGNLENNHQNLEDGDGDRLSAESLSLIDTRLLSQSELRALSQCSSLAPSSSASLASSAGGDDDLTPKIDRSVFNESAGSRKQTFLRVRLARDPPLAAEPPPPQRQRDETSSEEKYQVASLLRSLFCVDLSEGKAEEEDEGEEENEGQPMINIPIHYNRNVYQNSIQNVLVQGISGNETGRRRGRPRKIRNPSDGGTLSIDKTCSNLGISMDSNSGKRKRGRPPKNRDGFNQLAMKRKGQGKDEIVDLENREGTVVDLTALANHEDDPYGEELRRLSVGLGTKEELSGFLEHLNGEWVNAGKKKKLVEASDYGGYLPQGWKLMLCIKKKGSNLSLACRRYLSPYGQEFETCKEVSAYLQSRLESRKENRLSSLQPDNKNPGQVVMANGSSLGNSSSMDLSVLGYEPNQNQNNDSGRTSSEVLEEGKDPGNGDVTEAVKASMVDMDDMKKRDDSMENLAALINSDTQAGEHVIKTLHGLSSAAEELFKFWSSPNP